MSRNPRPVTNTNTIPGTRRRRVQLTNAQVKALRATPITLIPAPGAGRAVVVDSIYLVSDAAEAAWTESSDNLALEYSGGTDILTVETTGFLDQAAVEARIARPAVALTEPVPNEAVRIVNSGDGEFGGGDAANSLSVLLEYRILPVAAF